MIKGKVILGKSINSRGSNYNYYYLDTKDLRFKTFGNNPQEAVEIARKQFNEMLQEALDNYIKEMNTPIKLM